VAERINVLNDNVLNNVKQRLSTVDHSVKQQRPHQWIFACSTGKVRQFHLVWIVVTLLAAVCIIGP